MSCIQNTTNQTTSCQATANSSSFSLASEPAIVFSLIAALALVGNYVVCRAVWRNPGPKPNAHYLVSNLAFAEIVSMVCLVFTFHAYEPPWSWKLGHVMCKILEPLQVASLLVVTTTLAILALYRCVLLIKPMVTKPTRRQTCCVILVSWAGAVGLSVPAGHFRVVNSYGDKGEIHYCEELFPEGYKQYLFSRSFRHQLCPTTCHYGDFLLVGRQEGQRAHLCDKKASKRAGHGALVRVSDKNCCRRDTRIRGQENRRKPISSK